MLAKRGTYTLQLRTTTTSPFYTLTLLTPPVNQTMVKGDADAVGGAPGSAPDRIDRRVRSRGPALQRCPARTDAPV
jgi:hypothetical protein